MIQSIGYDMVATPVQSLKNTTQAPATQAQSGTTGDTVTISSEAMAVSKTAANLSARGLDSLPALLTAQELDELSEDVQSRITALFLENDISTDPPVELTVDEQGALRVKGEHPNKDKIEQLLANEKELSNDFRQVAATTEIHEAGARHIEFMKAYEQDPEAALIRFSYLFDGRPDGEPFSMVIGAKTKA
ncbi:hypothetical protein [Pseudodesulfovibrio sediminis]|uniref:Uncharacterized protein n=1 Tax=Pseudodesulfovibrio sediminis TaxID=2810563 RepID=A0ABN6EXY8_9BACT|nr:hypothetical protein [Pseudodesulfovibrio sediminis]BCS90055.1 hypothetical protein PSDVSF_32970 [Pseudodesulfovibrio sediminis]